MCSAWGCANSMRMLIKPGWALRPIQKMRPKIRGGHSYLRLLNVDHCSCKDELRLHIDCYLQAGVLIVFTSISYSYLFIYIYNIWGHGLKVVSALSILSWAFIILVVLFLQDDGQELLQACICEQWDVAEALIISGSMLEAQDKVINVIICRLNKYLTTLWNRRVQYCVLCLLLLLLL